MSLSSGSPLITAIKGRTNLHFQPSPPDDTFSASQSVALTSSWQQRLPSTTSTSTSQMENRAFRPPERTQSQKYDAWRDIFQRKEFKPEKYRTQAKEKKEEEEEEDEYYYEYYYDDDYEEEEKDGGIGKKGKNENEYYSHSSPTTSTPSSSSSYANTRRSQRQQSESRPQQQQQQRRQQQQEQKAASSRRKPVSSRRDDEGSDAAYYDYDYDPAFYNDIRRDDGPITLQSLANKDYSSGGGGQQQNNNQLAKDRSMTARIAEAVFNPVFGALFAAVGIPTAIAGGYYVFQEYGPTPVVQARKNDNGYDVSNVVNALSQAVLEAVMGDAEKYAAQSKKGRKNNYAIQGVPY